MTTPGPRPLPKNVREITGGRKAKSAAKNEVELPVRIPPPPDYLTADEMDVYADVTRKLAGMRVMNEACVDAVVLYCRNWIEAKNAHEKVLANGLVIRSPNDYPIVNPFLSIRRKAEDRCMRIMQEFGLTPSAMTRVNRERT
jgi:P27 family predicted phage terminase small subunit